MLRPSASRTRTSGEAGPDQKEADNATRKPRRERELELIESAIRELHEEGMQGASAHTITTKVNGGEHKNTPLSTESVTRYLTGNTSRLGIRYNDLGERAGIWMFEDIRAPEECDVGPVEMSWEERAKELQDKGGVPERRAQVVALIEAGRTHRETAEELGLNGSGQISVHLKHYRQNRREAQWISSNGPNI